MYPPGMYPPGMYPLGMYPLGMYPPGMYPPGMYPPGLDSLLLTQAKIWHIVRLYPQRHELTVLFNAGI